MRNTLQKIFFVFVGLSVPLGFFVEHDHIVFWWHHIPSLDVIIGGAGPLLLLMLMKAVSSLASKKEDFYD